MVIKKLVGVLFFFFVLGALFFKFSADMSSMGVDGYVSLGNEIGIVGNHLKASSAFKNALKLDLSLNRIRKSFKYYF